MTLLRVLAFSLLLTQSFLSGRAEEPSIKQINLPNFHEVVPGLYRGGRLKKVEMRDAEMSLKSLKVRTILNLEREPFNEVPGEVKKERKWAEEHGFKFIHLPMSGFFPPDPGYLDEAIKVLRDKSNWPLYVHCDHGEDRTGLVIGAYRVLVEKGSPERAFQEMRDLGYGSWLYDVLGWKKMFFDYVSSRKN